MSSETKKLQLEWTFQAPIDLVFDALTLPEHLKHWYCPDHLKITFAESDAKIGGEYRIGVIQKDGNGPEMMFLGKFLEIDRPHLLVYSQAFSMGNDYPMTPETKISIHLTNDGSKTLLKLIQTGLASKESFEGAKMSWPGVYTKLGNYLNSLS